MRCMRLNEQRYSQFNTMNHIFWSIEINILQIFQLLSMYDTHIFERTNEPWWKYDPSFVNYIIHIHSSWNEAFSFLFGWNFCIRKHRNEPSMMKCSTNFKLPDGEDGHKHLHIAQFFWVFCNFTPFYWEKNFDSLSILIICRDFCCFVNFFCSLNYLNPHILTRFCLDFEI